MRVDFVLSHSGNVIFSRDHFTKPPKLRYQSEGQISIIEIPKIKISLPYYHLTPSTSDEEYGKEVYDFIHDFSGFFYYIEARIVCNGKRYFTGQIVHYKEDFENFEVEIELSSNIHTQLDEEFEISDTLYFENYGTMLSGIRSRLSSRLQNDILPDYDISVRPIETLGVNPYSLVRAISAVLPSSWFAIRVKIKLGDTNEMILRQVAQILGAKVRVQGSKIEYSEIGNDPASQVPVNGYMISSEPKEIEESPVLNVEVKEYQSNQQLKKNHTDAVMELYKQLLVRNTREVTIKAFPQDLLFPGYTARHAGTDYLIRDIEYDTIALHYDQTIADIVAHEV
jgi:hypothetical protein